MPFIRSLSLILIFITSVQCASTTHSYRPGATIEENDDRYITDDDIRKAFEARPQIRKPANIAWYSIGSPSLVRKVQFRNASVTGNYDISTFLVEGSSRTRQNRHYYSDPMPLNLKQLRLYAARAHCDILVVISSDFIVDEDLNAFAVLNPFILPIFLTPYLHVTYSYEAEMLVFDVRNGYLYTHTTTATQPVIKKNRTIWNSHDDRKAMELLLEKEVATMLQNEIHKIFE